MENGVTSMKIYIDSDFKCHTTNPDGTFREVEDSFFDNKCAAFIEGYRFVPAGERWTRSDGFVFRGEMVAPWKAYPELVSAQQQHEILTEYESALTEIEAALGV